MGSVFARRVVRYGILSHQRSFLFRHIDSDVGNDCCRLSAARPFAIATALPVLIVAWILAFSVQHIGSFYGKMQTVQKWLNRIVGSIFAIIGLYYCVIMYLLGTKLLQKSEMRKEIVIELSYKGFSRASDYS